MGSNKAYLNCLEREQAQAVWQNKLTECGYFSNYPVEEIPVASSLGRVTTVSIYAQQSVPHYNGAAMDGIAVLAQNTFGAQETEPVGLTVLSAGEPFADGCCYLVDTGDIMPEGTNAVVMIEDVHVADGKAEILAAVPPWHHVRVVGEDIVAHEMVLPECHVITPVDIAAMLAAGLETVPVVKRPKVAIIPTGDEIVETRAELVKGTILDVNSHMLAAAVREWGGEANRMSVVKDDRQVLKRTIFASLQISDMVIINAGTSAGRDDYTAEVLEDLGEILVHGVAIKPGKPTVLAICQGKPVIGLPGYPASAMLTAELFVRDILTARQKLPCAKVAQVEAVLGKQVTSTIGVEEYIKVSVGQVEGRMLAAPLSRGAGLISSLTKAQGMLRIDNASAGIAAGTRVLVNLFPGESPENTLLAIGSHDLALELLGVFLRRRTGYLQLACANVGSMGGVMAIKNHEAHIAGIHLLEEETGRYNVAFVKKYLPEGCHLVHFAMREQGLMVKKENPKGIRTLADLWQPGIRFVNRQRGSGTRMLLDYELKKAGISGQTINGYEKELGTHMAVAASVAAGVADVGLGVQAAAQALGLAFIPVAEEQYDLLLNFAAGDPRLALILEVLESTEFRQEVESWGGYDLRGAGNLIYKHRKIIQEQGLGDDRGY